MDHCPTKVWFKLSTEPIAHVAFNARAIRCCSKATSMDLWFFLDQRAKHGTKTTMMIIIFRFTTEVMKAAVDRVNDIRPFKIKDQTRSRRFSKSRLSQKLLMTSLKCRRLQPPGSDGIIWTNSETLLRIRSTSADTLSPEPACTCKWFHPL
ncbi:hypothetical protein BDN72DRAFT_832299 [Pluteus cervinus]|uniref:Uncharacterized protein n=1 Tax=Pluteus cervinus TaxID=181527 RepID=A0ACD3BBJ8_9AGAR|nr:hypothetical protein BDN72DRAFT_832299 [Pluteus cervinus]